MQATRFAEVFFLQREAIGALEVRDQVAVVPFGGFFNHVEPEILVPLGNAGHADYSHKQPGTHALARRTSASR